MDAALRRRLFFLAGKPDDELTPSEHTELFRLFATWNACEEARADREFRDSGTATIEPDNA